MTATTTTHAKDVSRAAGKAGVPRRGRASSKGRGGEPTVAQAPDPVPRDLLVPLDRLVLGEANVRRVQRDEGIAELAALIESQGLLQRLAVVALPDGWYAVVAGGRRLRSMQRLAAEGRMEAAQAVECRCFADARAAEISLAENSGREAMHPADEMEAFRALVDGGLTVAQVASRFGVAPLTVERRLRLARLAPRFLAMYRADEIEPDQLQALALTDDHAAQEAVWDGLPIYERSAWALRRKLTEASCAGGSRLARFVGLAAYEARGGAVRRDLFAEDDDDDGVYLDDPVLLQVLAMEKLHTLAEDVRAEGWAWVECVTEGDALALRRYGQASQERRSTTPEEDAALTAMDAGRDRLAEALELLEAQGDEAGAADAESGDATDDEAEAEMQRLSSALDALDDRIDAAHAALRAWMPDQMAHTGVLLRIDHRGEVVASRGLTRPEDRHSTSDADDPAGEGGGEGDEGGTGAGVARTRPAFSEKLMRDLTAHRTAALQAALMQDPHVALATLVHRMAETVFGQYGRGNDVVKVHLHVTGDYTLAQSATGYEESPAGALLMRAASDWEERLPGEPQALFRWLLAQPRDLLLDLLAYCTARSIDAVVARERTADQSDGIAEVLGLDMADWWVPTSANYLGHVSKAKAHEAVHEATGEQATPAVAAMKKAEAAAHCTRRLEGTRWLPSPLRPLAAPQRSGEIEA
ncbi:ParB family chromosome partitioning protein [Variovorax boronicumulans]|uniref:ParB/RepB/Spo0J family partition protein n=1 Tax=Variovorax boronicumulans TaxID=436515 RepID=UPI0024735A14|nr:ParB/RepB/Spo0J family partition protein [Variovorax boronicumulans]MDH6170064.1 ParB family chromosome partitioning protein [Variovorax boronicumulans]